MKAKQDAGLTVSRLSQFRIGFRVLEERAALGRPTLDWLGCGRHGAHAEDEHIRISTIAPRAALLYDLLVSAVFQNKVVG